ncbi:MAG TPA: hypothetical protein VFA45_00790 [Actinomycetes bacterium]|jgi:hypothetical protein|nr:hypothetical protein [Actinomycetes bacterium]
MRPPAYSTSLPADEACPTVGIWEEFWASPPSSLDDPRLAEYLAAEADWTRPLDIDEAVCDHCLRQAGQLRSLIVELERRAAERSGGER